jgi:hypothetical protein
VQAGHDLVLVDGRELQVRYLANPATMWVNEHRVYAIGNPGPGGWAWTERDGAFAKMVPTPTQPTRALAALGGGRAVPVAGPGGRRIVVLGAKEEVRRTGPAAAGAPALGDGDPRAVGLVNRHYALTWTPKKWYALRHGSAAGEAIGASRRP